MLREDKWTAEVTFCVKKPVHYGRGVYVVGSLPELGEWSPTFSVKLFWSEFDNWRQTITLEFPLKDTRVRFEYKYIEADYEQIEESRVRWDDGPNHVLELRKEDPRSSQIPQGVKSAPPGISLCQLQSEAISFTKKRSVSLVGSSEKQPVLEVVSYTPCKFVAITQKAASVDMICLQNITKTELLDLMPHLPRFMYYGEILQDEKALLCPILYKYSNWKLLAGDAVTFEPKFGNNTRTNSNQQLTWAEFKRHHSSQSFDNLTFPPVKYRLLNCQLECSVNGMRLKDRQVVLKSSDGEDDVVIRLANPCSVVLQESAKSLPTCSHDTDSLFFKNFCTQDEQQDLTDDEP